MAGIICADCRKTSLFDNVKDRCATCYSRYFRSKSGQSHLLVRFASLAFRAPDVTLASVRTLAANDSTVSVVFCGWGRGGSNLWRDEGADWWCSFICKKIGINPKSPLVSYVAAKVLSRLRNSARGHFSFIIRLGPAI